MSRGGFLVALASMLLAPWAVEAAEPSVVVTLTAYCPCTICCGPWSRYGLTASQTRPTAAFTLASRQWPIGTVIRFDGSLYQVHDLGGPRENGFDVFFATHREAIRFGVQRRRVQIVHVPREKSR